jgi:hypothetical protein
VLSSSCCFIDSDECQQMSNSIPSPDMPPARRIWSAPILNVVAKWGSQA